MNESMVSAAIQASGSGNYSQNTFFRFDPPNNWVTGAKLDQGESIVPADSN
jgi:hypothetical protein